MIQKSQTKKNKIADIISIYLIFSFLLTCCFASGKFAELWKEIDAQHYLSNHLFIITADFLHKLLFKILALTLMMAGGMGMLRLILELLLRLFRIRLVDDTSEKMNRRFRKTAAVILLFLLVMNMSFFIIIRGMKPRGPNIILIGADTLRADHLRCYGYARDTSAAVDKLAREGVVFLEAWSHISSTTPSFATIFTSKIPMSHGVLCNTSRGFRLEKQHTTIAELLKNKGYKTAAFTSGFSMKKSSQLAQGFDVFNDDFKVERRAESVNCDVFKWLNRNRKEKFFLFIHYFDPHGQYRPPPPYNEVFPYTKKEYDINRIPPYQRHRPISDPSFYIAQYDGEIKYMDDHIDRLLKKLDKLGLSEDTVIIFTADHGETLDDHKWWFEHGHYIYDEQIHIPLIVWYPKVFKHKEIDTTVTHLDIVPTILDILGIDFTADIEGRSLLDLIRGARRPEGFFYHESQHGRAGIRDGDEFSGLRSKHFAVRWKGWKLIRIPKTTGIYFELYNLREDPGELNNLIGQHPEVEQKLKGKLLHFVGQYQNTKYYLERIGHPTEKQPDLSTEEMEALRSLGYLQ